LVDVLDRGSDCCTDGRRNTKVSQSSDPRLIIGNK
jgi:hypothetical protein